MNLLVGMDSGFYHFLNLRGGGVVLVFLRRTNTVQFI